MLIYKSKGLFFLRKLSLSNSLFSKYHEQYFKNIIKNILVKFSQTLHNSLFIFHNFFPNYQGRKIFSLTGGKPCG
jgi:hypothetical protein